MKNLLYLLISIVWTFIIAFNVLTFINLQLWNTSQNNIANLTIATIFLVINLIFITILFCNSIKDFIFVLYFHLYLKKKLRQNTKNKNNLLVKKNSKVLLLYTTCNDFDPESLLASSNQNYSNYEVYILDDSYDKKYIDKINQFAKENPWIKVIRRKDRKGFKAGNINNFLQNYNINYDYFVLLDSDEIIPEDFITKTLNYFNNNHVGIVQANHKGTRGKNLFSNIAQLGIYPSWTTFISVKNKYGIVTLNGHGAMISKECYEMSGGFPEIVAEDLGFTINSVNAGYQIVFANDIICEEVFPIDYLAFKKRAIKWTQGNVEFCKKYIFKIFKLKIPFFKKVDLWLSVTSLSLSVLSIFILIINFAILYPIGFNYKNMHWSLWVELVLMIILIITPFINDFIFLFKKINFFKLLFYILFCALLYTSTIVCSIKTLILSLLGKKAKFIITPKFESKYTIWDAIKFNWLEIIVATILLVAIVIIHLYLPEYKIVGTIILSILSISLYSTIFLTSISNKFVKISI